MGRVQEQSRPVGRGTVFRTSSESGTKSSLRIASIGILVHRRWNQAPSPPSSTGLPEACPRRQGEHLALRGKGIRSTYGVHTVWNCSSVLQIDQAPLVPSQMTSRRVGISCLSVRGWIHGVGRWTVDSGRGRGRGRGRWTCSEVNPIAPGGPATTHNGPGARLNCR